MLRVHRITQAVELSVLVLLAAIVDCDSRRPDRHPRPAAGLPGRGGSHGGGSPSGHHGVEAIALKLSIVILTMGNRPAEVARAIDSTEPLRAAGAELIVVGNGADPPPVPAGR